MRGFLILLSVLLVLEGNEAYEQLHPRERGIVDKAIEKANQEFGKRHHLDYSSIEEANDEKGMLRVLLKPTSCEKITPAVHQGNCEIREKAMPQVSCVACNENMNCFLRKDHVKSREAVLKCLGLNVYRLGGGHFLPQTEENPQKTGCLGCI
ncbi:cystatin-like protein [Danio aesculapii]|uniref:cystatin-like protein n=1 Tax=Danio aesculapii TaxID=1142201 RepID=UPI0024C01597|nr:cystatin-like protein [Danio aesculapii]